MQLGLSFSVLLASVLLIISSSSVEARPAKRNSGVITLPLKRLHGGRSDVHPQLLLQQHMNRGHKRLARMTGRREPTEVELRSNIHKRAIQINEDRAVQGKAHNHHVGLKAGKHTKEARFNRENLNENLAVAKSGAKAHNGHHTADKALKLGATAAAAGAAGAGGAAAAAAVSAAATGNSTNAGVSPLDIAASTADSLTAANTPTDTNTLGLDIESDDVGYIATVQIGTPPQDYKILMDSGSADFWVGAGNCEEVQEQAAGAGAAARRGVERRKGGAAAQGGAGGGAAASVGCGDHTFLDAQTSSTFVDTKAPFTVTYGSGAVTGTIVTDNVAIAGLDLDAHTFGTAQGETFQFTGAPFDGLMGLAQSSLSQQNTSTPVESLASAGRINDAITSFKISRLADQKNDGEVTFGGLDATKFDPATLTTFANVNTDGFWEGAMPAVTVNGVDTGLTGRTAILDTGTTLIIAPPADAAAVHQNIQGAKADGQGGFTVPCTLTDSVALTFGNTAFAIDPRDIATLPVNAADPTGDCTSGISSGQVGGATEWLVGDVFLKNAYFSTDVGKNQISLAKLV